MFKEIKSRFLHTDDRDVVEINVDIKNVEDLLKNRENAASIEERLSKTLEEYLFKAVKCYPISQKVKFLIILKENQRKGNEEMVAEIVHSHFCYKVKETEIYLRQQFRQWAINSLIGISFLVLCLILGEVLDRYTFNRVIKIMKESLIIIGWVALWEPVTFILFGFRVIKKDKLYYRKLCDIPIDVVEKRSINLFDLGKQES